VTIHLEMLVFAALAGSLTTRLLLEINASVLFCVVLGLLVFGIVLFLLEKRFGYDLDGFYKLFSRIPLAWALTFCVGVYTYSFMVILQVPIWAVILVVGLVGSSCWYWVQKKVK
jgi:hypothetical protein